MEVVRFAPSPTGPSGLHLGGLRTALFNWLLARSTGGRVLLRIEDTDRARNVPGADARMRADLTWAGIRFDNEHDVWLQSKRAHIYADVADALLRAGLAYRCACPSGVKCVCDGTATTKSAIKLRISHEKLAVAPHFILTDAVYGHIRFDTSPTPDPVLVRGDGSATYALACAVDDRLSGVTTVLRGQEWLPATPVHVAVHRALTAAENRPWAVPRFAHLPLLRDARTGRKLSKRPHANGFPPADIVQCDTVETDCDSLTNFNLALQPDMEPDTKERDSDELTERHPTNHIVTPTPQIAKPCPVFVSEYQDRGILPAALCNYVALLGWSPTQHGSDGASCSEVFGMDDLVRQFSLASVNRADAMVDFARVLFFNRMHIKRDPDNPALAGHVAAALQHEGMTLPSEAYIQQCVRLFAGRLDSMSMIPRSAPYLFSPPDINRVVSQLNSEGCRARLQHTEQSLHNVDAWHADALTVCLGKDTETLRVLRVAVTGDPRGAPLAATLELLGKEEVLRRIATACSRLDTITRAQQT